MSYKEFGVKDFALDPYFRNWVIDPDKDMDRFWNEWLLKNPQKAMTVSEARELVQELRQQGESMSDLNIQMLWESIDNEISEKSHKRQGKIISMKPSVAVPSQKPTSDYQKVGSIAASIIIFMCVGLGLFFAQQAEVSQPGIIKHENPWGKRSVFYLSDGTEVILNSGSSIEFVKGFSENERRVHLSGEAFFKVAKNAQKPFKVVTGKVTTEALGTSFNIQAYKPKGVKVSLVTGKVTVNNTIDITGGNLILNPGEEALYTEDTGFVKGHFNPDELLSWTRGVIYFRNAGKAEVIEALERWYGVEITFQNDSEPERRWDYTASFKDQTLEHILISIGYAMDFDFEINDKSVVIKYK